MKFVYLFAIALAFSSHANADVEMRIPIVFTAYDVQSGEAYNLRASDLTKELADKGLEIPEYITIDESGDQEELGEYAQMVDDAGIVAPGSKIGLVLSVEQYGRLSNYETPGQDGVCYVNQPGKTPRQNAEEAYLLLTKLGDGVLSDQYSIYNYRFFDEPKFLESRDESGFGIDELNERYSSTKLSKGSVQIIASISDGGEDDEADILAPCTK